MGSCGIWDRVGFGIVWDLGSRLHMMHCREEILVRHFRRRWGGGNPRDPWMVDHRGTDRPTLRLLVENLVEESSEDGGGVGGDSGGIGLDAFEERWHAVGLKGKLGRDEVMNGDADSPDVCGYAVEGACFDHCRRVKQRWWAEGGRRIG